VSTIIITKYSVSNTAPTPGLLDTGEFAYSFVSNKMFIGNANGSFDIIGGKHYIDLIDERTSNVSANTLVKRDANGNISANTFIGNLRGTANTANTFASPVHLNFSGDLSGNVIVGDGDEYPAVDIYLTDIITGGIFGNATHIPIISVASSGRVINVNTVQITTQDSFDKANSAVNTANAAFAAANVLNPTSINNISRTILCGVVCQRC